MHQKQKNSTSPVFVAGATGYVGQAVVRQLVDTGARTIAHVRPDSSQLEKWTKRFTAIGAEVDTTEWSRDAMSVTMEKLQPASIFCLIGTTRARMHKHSGKNQKADPDSYHAVDYGLTALLLDAIGQAGIKPRFIYLSALGTGPKASGAYMEARYKAENTVIQSRTPYTIVRPAITTGPDREDSRPAELYAGKILDAILSVLQAAGMRSAARYRSISGQELAMELVRLAANPEAENTIVEREGLG